MGDEVVFCVRYAFLVARFKPEYYYFEALIQGQKAVLAAAVCGFRGPYLKASMAALVLVTSTMGSQPQSLYLWSMHNLMSSAATCAAAGALIGGTISDATASDGVVSSALTIVLLILVVGVGYEIYVQVKSAKEVDEEAVFGEYGLEERGMGVSDDVGMDSFGSTQLTTDVGGGEGMER